MPPEPEQGHSKTEAQLKEAISFTQSIVDTVREPLLVLDWDLRVTAASRAFYQTFRVSPDETLSHFIYDLGNGQWNIPALRTLLEEVLPQHKAFDDFEVVHNFPGIGKKAMLLNARKLWREANNTEHILLAIEDETERKRIFDELVRSNEGFSASPTSRPMTFVRRSTAEYSCKFFRDVSRERSKGATRIRLTSRWQISRGSVS
jgi:nitrogen-specific signal transduction histidine kinase